MKNPFSYSSLASYCSDNPSQHSSSFKYSRALTELQVSRHIHLVSPPLSPSNQQYFPSTSQLPSFKKNKKQNPFLYAKPFKFIKKYYHTQIQTKGLSKWEKLKYLQQYQLTKSAQIEGITRKGEIKTQHKQILEQYQQPKVSKDVPKKIIRKAEKSKEQVQQESKGIKNDYSFSEEMQLNFNKYQELNTPVFKQQTFQGHVQTGYGGDHKVGTKILMQQSKSEEDQRKSIIHTLDHNHQAKPSLTIASSKVEAFQPITHAQQQNKLPNKEVLQKIKQIESNLYLDQNKRQVKQIPKTPERYPLEFMFRHQKYELLSTF